MSEATVCTLVYLFRNNEVYLGKALDGPAEGKLSSYGGKLESEDISIEVCARREVVEESGGRIQIGRLKKSGVVTFFWNCKVPKMKVPSKTAICHIYRTDDWEGEPFKTDSFEKLEPWKLDQIPYHLMMPGEEVWFSQLIRNRQFTGFMNYRLVEGIRECHNATLHKRLRQELLTKP